MENDLKFDLQKERSKGKKDRKGEGEREQENERMENYFLLYHKHPGNTTSSEQNEYLFSSQVIFLLHLFPLLLALVLLEVQKKSKIKDFLKDQI